MKIAVITGTRPDIIKMAPFYWYGKNKVKLVHSMQHFTYSLYEGVYKDLNLKWPPHYEINNTPKRILAKLTTKLMYNFDERFNTKTLQWLEERVAKLMQPNISKSFAFLLKGFSNFFSKNYFDWVLVHGDTLTAAAAAIAADLNLLKVAHIEAGLRTGSKEPFPEQLDTRVADAASDLHFAAVERNVKNLINEGFPKKSIFLVGNTIVDTVNWAKNKGNSKFFENLGIDLNKPFVYFSAHRKENMMYKERFLAIVRYAKEIADIGYQVLWSVRPATRKAFVDYNIKINHPNIVLVDDIPNYTDIIWFISRSKFIATDSGSMQEEAAALHVPCLTLRYVTDRPETVDAKVNFLVKPGKTKSIKPAVKRALKIKRWPEIYGNEVTKKILLNLQNN